MSSHLTRVRAASDIDLLRALGFSAAVARDALERAGGLRALLALDPQRLSSITGLERRAYRTLQAARELGRRDLAASLAPGTELVTRDDAKAYALALTRDLPYETFHAVWVDAQQRVLHAEELSRGTIDTTGVYPREIIRRGLDVNATGAFLIHNHVSGVPTPSKADKRMTEHLVNLLATVRIQIFDHLIAGDGVVASFVELGILPSPNPDLLL